MKSIVQIALLAVTSASLAFAEAPANNQTPSLASDVQAITQIENETSDPNLKGEAAVAYYERLYAPEFFFTSPRGEVLSRAELMADLKTGNYVCTSCKIDDLKVVVIGDTAVVSGLETEKSTYKGKDSSGQFRYTDVYVRLNGTWRMVSSHFSKIPRKVTALPQPPAPVPPAPAK